MQSFSNTTSLIPCEICNEMIDFNSYSTHVSICLRRARVTGFFIRQQRQILGEDTDDDQEEESNIQHQRDITTLRGYFTRNSQVSGMTLHDLINDHFTGVSSPPTRSVIWFNIGGSPSTSTSSANYDINLRIGDMIGKVEIGLNEEQLREVSYVSNDIEELNIKDDDICPICQINMFEILKIDKACLLACGHTYCDTCIKKWLTKNKKCPVCLIDLEDAYCWGR